jgi:D-alanine--poly(phosphoribitol) ligase subunit 1
MEINVLEWLEKTAAEYPDKTVFSDSENSIDFSYVLKNAKAIGSAIAAENIYRQPIAVVSGRHIITPVAFLGVVYSGCFYAPIDAHLPVARINQILETLNPALILTDRENEDFIDKIGYTGKTMIIEVAMQTEINQARLDKIRRFANENDPLYVIFTSGSTGRPKGVITSHHSLMCYIDAYSSVMKIDSSDVLGNQSPLDYIAAIRDIYLPMRHGCSTVIIPKEFFMSPALLFDYMNKFKVTSIGWSVSALTVPASLGAFQHGHPEFLKKICFSGSVMPCKYLRIWQENLPDAHFVNQYGPTEATASCTYYVVNERVTDDYTLPIGLPYRDYRTFLLSPDNESVPDGQEGEICVSGPILALGYYNDPERTADSFIQNPLNKLYRELIYKTGDIGMVRPDGILEFHGRKDRQIKHLGHRVELDEVERAGGNVEGVDECCVLYNKEKEIIYLYYTGTAQVKTIALELRKILPGFMVPRKIVCLDSMPKLPNGKIDMNTLKNSWN